MSDIQFKNRAEIKWFDTYDSYFIESNVSTDTGAELDLGSTEVLAGKSITKSNTSGLLTLGLIEILASAIPSISIGTAELNLGNTEILSSNITIASNVISFITMGVAEGISTTCFIQSNAYSFLSLGIIELIGSSSISNSLVNSEITLGIETFLHSTQNIISKTSIPILVLGEPEALYGSSHSSTSLSGFIILGKEEAIFSKCHVYSSNIVELTLGVNEYMTSFTPCESYGIGLLSTGIVELLGSTSTIISIATNLSIDLGRDEYLTNSTLINTSVSTTEITLGKIENISSSITIKSLTNIVLTVGIEEILGTSSASTLNIYSNLFLGTIEHLTAKSLVKSSISSFLIKGTTEVLSSKIQSLSFIRRGSSWSTLTIGHVELLAHTVKVISIVSHNTLTTGIIEPLTYINHKIQSNVNGLMLIGVVELLSSAIASSISAYEAELTLGIDNKLSSSININSSCSSFILMGETETLSSSIKFTSSQHSNLLRGQLELLASSVFSISVTDSDIIIGGSETLTGTSKVRPHIYAILVTGAIENLSFTIIGTGYVGPWSEEYIKKSDFCVSSTIGSLLVGEVEFLSASKINASTTIATLHLGRPELLSSHVSFSTNIESIITLGVNEKLRVSSEIISTTSSSELTIGIIENLNSLSLTESLSNSVLTTGLPEELSGTIQCYSDVKSILGVGLSEILLSTTNSISTSSASTLLTGQIEILASSTFSITVLNSYLKIGIDTPLSSTVFVESMLSGNLIEGWAELLKAKSNIVSFVRKGGRYSSLTLGVKEILNGTSRSKTGIREPSLILGIFENLTFSNYHICSSNCNGLLTIGKVEILGVSETINSVVDSELSFGIIEELSSTLNIKSYSIADISFGVIESLSTVINIASSIDSDIIIGAVKLMASTVATTSNIILDIFVGSDESLSSLSLVESNITTYLTLGVANQVKSSLNITSNVSSNVYLGITELVSGWAPISSVVNISSLILGINELMSSNSYIISNIKGRFNTGILEVLGASTSSHSIIPGELTLGIIEELEAINNIESLIKADITLGAISELSSSILITSNINVLLLIGEVEILATSNFSVSILNSQITLGIEENLEYTSIINSNVSAELTLGVYEYLSSTENIITNTIDASLSVGLIEILATSNFSITITEASLTFGEENPLKSHVYIQSYLNNTPLIIGVTELLSSILASTSHFPPAELTLGIGERLTSTINIQNVISDVLNLGGQENLSSSITFTHLVENTIDLVIGGPVPVSGKSKSKSYAIGTWLYVPGALEELEARLYIKSIVPDSEIFRDKELISSSIKIVSTTWWGILSLGVVEVAASSNFSVSTTAASLALGVGYILNSSGTSISSDINGELTIGKIESLTGRSFFSSVIFDVGMVIGVVELVSSSMISISIIRDAILSRGRLEILSSKPKIISKTKAFLNIPGNLELLESSIDIHSLIKDGLLDIGYISLPGSTVLITTSSDASIDNGNSEELESRIFIYSDINSYMSLGINTESSGNCIVSSNVNDTYLDKPIIFESNVFISTYSIAEIYFGDFEEIIGIVEINSNVEGILITGDVTEISSIAQIESLTGASLTSPTIWIRTDIYSAWNKIISTIHPIYIDINKTIDLYSTSRSKIEVNASIIYGEQTELSGSSLIQSYVTNPILVTGIVELLSISNFSISITDATLICPIIYVSSKTIIQTNIDIVRLAGPQQLTGRLEVKSNITGNIVDGIVELVSVHENIISFVNNVALKTGIIEELSSTVLIKSSITIPNVVYNIFLNSFEEFAWNKVTTRTSFPTLNTYNGFFSSTCRLSSSTKFILNLTIGIVEKLSSIVTCLSKIPDIDLNFGVSKHLTSHSIIKSNIISRFEISDLYTKSLSETEVWGTLLLGVAEQIGTGTVKIKSNVRSETLMLGGLDFYGTDIVNSNTKAILGVNYYLQGKSNTHSLTNIDLSIGYVTNLTSKTNIISLVNSDISLGKEKSLSSISKSRVRISGFITIGVEHSLRSKIYVKTSITNDFLFIGDRNALFSQIHLKTTIITPYLIIGTEEVLSSTSSIISIFKPLQLITGSSELVSSISISNSIADASLNIGEENIITSINSSSTSIGGHLSIGKIESLSTTVQIGSHIVLNDALYNSNTLTGKSYTTSNTLVSDLILGVLTLLTAKSESKTSFVVEYVYGNIEKLSGKVSYKSYCVSTLFIGYAERLSSTVIIGSYVNDLDFGETIEPISSTSNIKLSINAFINTGITEKLSSSNNIISVINYSELFFGCIESLSSNLLISSQSNSDTIQLEIEHNSRGSIHTFIPDTTLSLGVIENLSGKIIVSIDSTIEAIMFGAHEILDAKAIVKSNTPTARLSFGYTSESLNGFISVSSYVLMSEIDSETYIKHKNKITSILQTSFNKFSVNNKTLNINQIPFPNASNQDIASFIDLLLNDDYREHKYRYLYREVINKAEWPADVRSRLMLDPDNARYFVTDGDDPQVYNLNIYNIKPHDLIMLDRLLVYRLEPYNATLAGINYKTLSTSLSKMIYIYLELKLTGNYSKYNNTAIFTHNKNALEVCYENYLTQTVFEHVSSKGT